MEFLLQLDGNILLWIQEYLRNDVFTVFWKAMTFLGDEGWFWLASSILMLFFKKTRKIGIVSLFSIALCFLVTNQCLKNMIARPRPFNMIPELTILIDAPSSYSFPSGHTANSFAMAFIYYKMMPKKWGVAAIVIASLIAFSRLYLGVHYPSDVLGGVLVAWVCSMIVYQIYLRIIPKKQISV